MNFFVSHENHGNAEVEGYNFVSEKMFAGIKSDFLAMFNFRDKYLITMTCSLLERKFLLRLISKSRKANDLKFCTFTSIIGTIIGRKFQINP